MTKLLTAKDLAARWQVPASQVYRLAREGQIPAVRLGRYWRFRLDLIEEWELQSTTGDSLQPAPVPVPPPSRLPHVSPGGAIKNPNDPDNQTRARRT